MKRRPWWASARWSAAPPTSPPPSRRRVSSSRPACTAAWCSARCSGSARRCRDRVARIHEALAGADIQSEPVADARVPLWSKFIYLAAFAGFTGAARLPIGPLWQQPGFRALFLQAAGEIEQVARAEGVAVRCHGSRRHHEVHRVDSADNPLVAPDRPRAGQAHRGRGAARIRRASRCLTNSIAFTFLLVFGPSGVSSVTSSNWIRTSSPIVNCSMD